MNESIISRIIVQRSSLFSLRSSGVYFLMRNVSWGLFCWGEVDLLVCSKALYLTDIEIKTSIIDLKADFRKKKWGTNHLVNKEFLKDIKYHYYAIPEELSDKAISIINEFKPNSGILIIKRVLKNSGGGYYIESCRVEKRAKANKLAKPMKTENVINLARLAMFRYWRDGDL